MEIPLIGALFFVTAADGNFPLPPVHSPPPSLPMSHMHAQQAPQQPPTTPHATQPSMSGAAEMLQMLHQQQQQQQAQASSAQVPFFPQLQQEGSAQHLGQSVQEQEMKALQVTQTFSHILLS